MENHLTAAIHGFAEIFWLYHFNGQGSRTFGQTCCRIIPCRSILDSPTKANHFLMKHLAKALVLINFSTQGDTTMELKTEMMQNKMLQQLASCRLQLAPISQALDRLGLESYSLSPLIPIKDLKILDGVKLIIIGKITVNPDKVKTCHATIMQYLLAAKKLNIPVVTMYSNHHLADRKSIWNNLYRDIIAQSRKVICPHKD